MRSRYRSNIPVTAGAAGASVVLDNHRSRASAVDSQSRLFSDPRARDDGFQSAVVTLRANRAEPKDKRSVKLQPIAIPIPPNARLDKGLSASLCLALFLLGPKKVASKKMPGTNARAAPLTTALFDWLAENFILETGCHATRRATQLCGETSAHFRCADRQRLHYVRRASESAWHPSSYGLDYSQDETQAWSSECKDNQTHSRESGYPASRPHCHPKIFGRKVRWVSRGGRATGSTRTTGQQVACS